MRPALRVPWAAVASIYSIADKGDSQKLGFRFTLFSETEATKREGRGAGVPPYSLGA
jgi:hypothetical protein